MIHYFAFMLVLLVVGCSSSKSKQQSSEIHPQPSEVVVAEAFSSASDTAGLAKISGDLNYSGSEPLAWPTIFISDTVSYRLNADTNFIKETYLSLNGNYATLYGKVIQKGALTYFQVYYYEVTQH